jgi:hypothetical protein
MHANGSRSDWRNYVTLWSVLCKYLDITGLSIKDGYEISMYAPILLTVFITILTNLDKFAFHPSFIL